MASMTVPEATIHNNKRLVFRKDHIGFSRNIFYMKSKAVAECMQPLSDKNLWTSIFCFDAGHHPAPGCFIYDIGHQASKYCPNAFITIG